MVTIRVGKHSGTVTVSRENRSQYMLLEIANEPIQMSKVSSWSRDLVLPDLAVYVHYTNLTLPVFDAAGVPQIESVGQKISNEKVCSPAKGESTMSQQIQLDTASQCRFDVVVKELPFESLMSGFH